MARDDRVVLLGEDVGRNGGVFRVTDGALRPVRRRARVRHAARRVGDHRRDDRALGRRARARSPRSSSPASACRRTTSSSGQLARLRYRSRGRFHCPVTVRAPYGGGVRTPEHHADSVEAPYAHTPGLKVVVPSNAADAKGLLASAIREPDPVLVPRADPLLPQRRATSARRRAPGPLGRARVVREPGDAVIIAWGAMVDGRAAPPPTPSPSTVARTSASSTCARCRRSTSTPSCASPSRRVGSSSCTRRRSPRASAPRSWRRSRRRRSSRSRRRSAASPGTTSRRPCRWSRTGAAPTSPRSPRAVEASLDA